MAQIPNFLSQHSYFRVICEDTMQLYFKELIKKKKLHMFSVGENTSKYKIQD
jgi:hypothetical protein